jgi:hypothetical protein
MLTSNNPKIKRRSIAWKDREHLFTPENITKYEFACCRDCIYRKLAGHPKVKALACGPVVWIMRDGKPVDLTSE